MKELDVLLSRILEQDYQGYDLNQQKIFEEFLETPDPVLLDWVMGRSTDYPVKYGFLISALDRKL